MALVGAFLWLSNMTRSEISHVTSQLARFISRWPVTARAQRISVQGALLALVCHILTNRPYGTAPVVSELVLW